MSNSGQNRFKGRTKKVKRRNKKPVAEEHVFSRTYQKLYGNYKGKPQIVAGIPIFPIYGCTYKVPSGFKQDINKYTPHGRRFIHSNLHSANHLVRYLLNNKEYNKSVEYNDNRISLMAGQYGKCGVTGEPLVIGNMECHHKKPKELGGTDEYKNLVWLQADIHKLIHATQPDTINKYLMVLNLEANALKMVNSLRLLAENLEIVANVI